MQARSRPARPVTRATGWRRTIYHASSDAGQSRVAEAAARTEDGSGGGSEGTMSRGGSRLPPFPLRGRVWLIGPLALYSVLRIPRSSSPTGTRTRPATSARLVRSSRARSSTPRSGQQAAPSDLDGRRRHPLPRNQRSGPPHPHLPDRRAHPAGHRLRRGPASSAAGAPWSPWSSPRSCSAPPCSTPS